MSVPQHPVAVALDHALDDAEHAHFCQALAAAAGEVARARPDLSRFAIDYLVGMSYNTVKAVEYGDERVDVGPESDIDLDDLPAGPLIAASCRTAFPVLAADRHHDSVLVEVHVASGQWSLLARRDLSVCCSSSNGRAHPW